MEKKMETTIYVGAPFPLQVVVLAIDSRRVVPFKPIIVIYIVFCIPSFPAAGRRRFVKASRALNPKCKILKPEIPTLKPSNSLTALANCSRKPLALHPETLN